MKKLNRHQKAKVFGLLQFAGNTYPKPGNRAGTAELSLDGQTIDEVKALINGREIIGYGEDQLGDEAALFVTPANRQVRGLAKVKALFGQ